MSITKKQKEVYEYIVHYTQREGISPTQKEIKEHFNFKSFGSVQRYIKYLTDAGYLEADWNARRGLKTTGPEHVAPEGEIPLLGAVAAGNPIEAIESATERTVVPPSLLKKGGQYFALEVQGDSMIEDGILDGDIAVIKAQQTANRNDTVVAVVEGEATLKHYSPHKDRIELIPANSSMSPIVVTGGDFKIAGVLVGLVRRYA